MDIVGWIVGLIAAWALVSLWGRLKRGRGVSFSDWWHGDKGPQWLGRRQDDLGASWRRGRK
jgi:hypothetical protein